MTAPELKTPTDLKSNATKSVAEALNGVLADSYALYFKTKNFHWHVSGPHFRDYHLMFDDQATQILATTDLIAERVRKTGNTTLRSVGDIARHQSVVDNDADYVSPADMLKELREDNLMVHDLWLVQVKTPAESKYPWDYYKILAKISGEDAFGPPDPACPMVKK